MKIEYMESKHPFVWKKKELQELANALGNKISHKQREIIKGNLYTLQTDEERKLYNGAGFGWVEFDIEGDLVALRYAKSFDEEGSVFANKENIDIFAMDVKLLENGNIRLMCNFSSYQICRF